MMNIKIRGYGIFTSIYIILSLVTSRFFFPSCRLIRLPWFVRIQGRLILGASFCAGRCLRLDIHPGGVCEIGENVKVNDNCQIACGGHLTIGSNTLIASKVFITDHDHSLVPSRFDHLNISDTHIGSGCWIGNNCSILKGVHLGDNCIVGAGSVVTHSFSSGSMIAGVPARLIRRLPVSNS